MDLLFLHYNESVQLGFNFTTYLTKPTKSQKEALKTVLLVFIIKLNSRRNSFSEHFSIQPSISY